MCVLAMHQPNFLPWIGFFHKLVQADVFVLMDTAQVPRGRSYAHRVRIKRREGGQRWLSLPCHRPNMCTYSEATVTDDAAGAMRGVIEHNYRDAVHFDDYANTLYLLLHAVDSQSLALANEALIRWARVVLGITTEVVRQSDMGVEAPKERLPVELCRALGADVYLSGTGARTYNDQEIFDAAGVGLRYTAFECPEYTQVGDSAFAPNLSVIDLIFNCGPRAGGILGGV